MSQRGNYFLYLYDSNKKMPKSTYYRKKALGLLHENNEARPSYYNVENDVTPSNNEYMELVEQNEKESEIHIEIEDSVNVEELGEALEDIFENKSEPLSLESICAILLIAFYTTRMTQFCFKLIIQAMKTISKIDIPITFDGISNILLKDQSETIQSQKRWFCASCKVYANLEKRYQRNCSKCDEKFIFKLLFK
jgi:hypothetical protein